MNEIKVASIENRWGQIIYPTQKKQPSVAELLIKEQKKCGFLKLPRRLAMNLY